MTLSDIVEELGLEVRSGFENLHREITRGYISDLMSDVLAHAREGDLWITLQVHQNVAAVALMKDLAGVVLVNGREPQEDMAAKATAEALPVMISPLPAFELAGRLYKMGLSGY